MPDAQISSALLRAPAGIVDFTATAGHILTVHAEGRIGASFRCDNLNLNRQLTPGDIDLIPAETPARLIDDGPNAVLALTIPTSLVTRQADELGGNAARLRPLAGLRDSVLSDLAWRLQRRSRQGRVGLYDDCMAEELVSRLLWRHGPQMDENPAARIGTLGGARLRRVLDLIEGEIDGPLHIGRLAAEARLAPTTFKIGFRKAMGRPVHQYVVRRRARRARLMLLEGAMPPSQVALEAGFSHQTHMARWLRRLYGALPSELANKAS
jgi:AraC family transcriptional regulator